MNTIEDFKNINFIFEKDRVQKLHPKGDTAIGKKIAFIKEQIKNRKPGDRWTGIQKKNQLLKNNDEFKKNLFEKLGSNPVLEKVILDLLEKNK